MKYLSIIILLLFGNTNHFIGMHANNWLDTSIYVVSCRSVHESSMPPLPIDLPAAYWSVVFLTLPFQLLTHHLTFIIKAFCTARSDWICKYTLLLVSYRIAFVKWVMNDESDEQKQAAKQRSTTAHICWFESVKATMDREGYSTYAMLLLSSTKLHNEFIIKAPNWSHW